ncbi:hypothetical protein [Rubritalea squalenifaciens]|nr:hypothetical protein [Rubritalea squalenifaciens]
MRKVAESKVNCIIVTPEVIQRHGSIKVPKHVTSHKVATIWGDRCEALIKEMQKSYERLPFDKAADGSVLIIFLMEDQPTTREFIMYADYYDEGVMLRIGGNHYMTTKEFNRILQKELLDLSKGDNKEGK